MMLSPRRSWTTIAVKSDRRGASLEHDPEKWKPVFPRDKRKSVCPEIMLKQRDEIVMQFHIIAS
jgi:hypothetical protein